MQGWRRGCLRRWQPRRDLRRWGWSPEILIGDVVIGVGRGGQREAGLYWVTTRSHGSHKLVIKPSRWTTGSTSLAAQGRRILGKAPVRGQATREPRPTQQATSSLPRPAPGQQPKSYRRFTEEACWRRRRTHAHEQGGHRFPAHPRRFVTGRSRGVS